MTDGVAEIALMTGATVSGGTTTSTDLVAASRAPSPHVSPKPQVPPPTASTAPVCGPVIAASPPVMLVSEQLGAASTLSVAETDTATFTRWPLGGAITDGVAEIALMTGAMVSAGTTTSTDFVEKLRAASTQVSVNT